MILTPQPRPRLYSPPAGFYDLPFAYCFDASVLATANNNPNQYLYIKGGLGDFILRRVVGLSRILSNSSTPAGTYHLADNGGAYRSNIPLYGGNADDIGIVPEMLYQETGAIKFDLGAVTLPTPAQTAQICFQGARRLRGTQPVNPTYRAVPRHYTYTLPLATVSAPVGTLTTLYQTIDNYDFELYDIVILEALLGAGSRYNWVAENGGTVLTNLSTSPITINIPDPAGPQLYSSTVVGSTITINIATEPSEMSVTQWIAAAAADPNLAGLLGVSLWPHTPTPSLSPAFSYAIAGLVLPGGGSPTDLTPAQGLSALWVYDANRVQIASAPVLSLFYDGSPVSTPVVQDGGVYGNGCVQPPLWYPQQSTLQIDFYSMVSSGSAIVQVYLVGKEYEPC